MGSSEHRDQQVIRGGLAARQGAARRPRREVGSCASRTHAWSMDGPNSSSGSSRRSRTLSSKSTWDQGDSWNLGLSCCDPIFDLAGVVAASQDEVLGRDLRDAFDALGGDPVDEERWLLYQLAHLTSGRDARYGEPPAWLDYACAKALQNYFHAVYFADVVASDDGPLCGIDLDGVLETEHLGFPALTPAAASALRALLAHGYRPLLVTGRSLRDVIERCRAYRLPGGVCEYGAAIYDGREDAVEILGNSEDREMIGRLRAELGSHAGVLLDERYMHAIRAFVQDQRGARRPLPQETLADAMRATDAAAVAIRGNGQTDIVAQSIDKARGTLALSARLAPGADSAADQPLAFAIGDSSADIPLLTLADRAFVPAHAAPALRARFRGTRAPYQRGFAEAVGELIGHRPGSCGICRLPPLSDRRRRLLGLLGVQESVVGRTGIHVLRSARRRA